MASQTTSLFFFSSRRRHTRSTRDWVQTCALPIYPEPGGVRLSPCGDVVAALHPGAGRHDAAGTEHEVARPAERVLAVATRPVAADGGKRAKPLVDLVPHLAHAGGDVVPADRR